MANRWWIYQKERFPVFAHGPLIASFSYCAVSYSALLRGEVAHPSAERILTAFICSFLFFLLLRIADEFKDHEEDLKFRPYRPVQRGLVTLRELAVLGVGAASIQFIAATRLSPWLIGSLGAGWLYLALMSREFFVRDWIKARPITYMWTHMMIMPIIDFHATACDWLVTGGSMPSGLYWFLLVSFFNGLVIEIGRKIRAPEDEEHGVETYSFLWGRRNATLAWFGAMFLSAVFAVLAAQKLGFLWPVAVLLVILLACAALLLRAFLTQPGTRKAKRIEAFSGVWMLVLYLALGALPHLI